MPFAVTVLAEAGQKVDKLQNCPLLPIASDWCVGVRASRLPLRGVLCLMPLLPENDIRERLRAFMDAQHMGPGRLSKHIREAWPILRGNTPIRGISRRTIARFLEGRDGSRSIRAESLKVIRDYLVHEGVIVDKTVTFYRSRDAVFDALCQLYGLDAGAMSKKAADYEGTFEFYSWSEDFKDSPRSRHVRGAITFSSRQEDGTALIEEIQKGEFQTEKWDGYFFEWGQMCIIVARRQPKLIPKVYILSPGIFVGGKVEQLAGRMLKVGDNGGVFSSGILMRRKDDAVAHCKIMAADKDMSDRLGPRPR